MSVLLCEKIQIGHYRGVNSAPKSWVALGVAAVGTATTIGTQLYNSSQQGSGGGYATPNYSGAIDYLKDNGATDYSGVLDYLNTGNNGAANFTPAIDYTKNNWATPNYQNYTPTGYATGLEDYLAQGGKYANQIGRMNDSINNRDNKRYRNDILQFSPQAARSSRQLSNNVYDMLQGKIPAGDIAQIQNATAEQSVFGGYGGSQQARNLTARDLGRTSLSIQQQGAQMLPGSIAASQSLNPYQSSTFQSLFTPQQLLGQATGENRYQNQVFNANATNTAQFKNQATAAISQLLAQGAISQADKERYIAGIMSQSAQSRAAVASQIAALMGQQQNVNAQGINTNNLLQQQNAQQIGNSISQGAGTLASIYGYQQPGTAQYPTSTQYGGTYTGSYNGQPVYRPAGV